MMINTAATALSLVLALGLAAASPAKKITLDVKDADLHNVLRMIADVGRINIVVPDDVKGRVTIHLRDVPWTEALDAILRTHLLGQEVAGNIVHVDRLDRINERRRRTAEIAAARRETAQLKTIMLPMSYAKAGDIKPLVQAMLTPRGRVEVDARTNTLIVTDIAPNTDEIERRFSR